MRTNYVLIDYENVQVKSLGLLKDDQFHVRVFLGPTNTKLPIDLVLAMQQLGERADYVILETPGNNALDFHVAFYLGALAERDSSGFFHIISRDTGFDPLVKHLKSRKIFAARSPSIEEMPCFTQQSLPTPEPKLLTAAAEIDFLSIAVDDLIKRKASKPRTQKTLWSTIQARCGKDVPKSTIDSVYERLIKMGYVKIEGTKVSYSLPNP